MMGVWFGLRRLWPLWAALLIAAASYRTGYLKAERQGKAELAALQAAHSTAALAAEQAYTAKLAEAAAEKQAWYDYAQAQSQQLAEHLRQTDAQAGYLKQEIPDALKRDQADGGCRNGLGADGLRLYKHAFGYPG